MVTTLRISAPPSTTSIAADSTSCVPSPIQLPSLPPLPFPISTGGIPQKREKIVYPEPRGPVQPAHGNVPRRARPLTPAQLRARRRCERCIQELGRASGIFVAFGCDSAEEDAEFGAVVRISANRDPDENGSEPGESVDDKGGGLPVLRFVAPGIRDDGVPCLRPAQLLAACAFVCGHRAEGHQVLITAPREHAVDALSVGVCCATRSALATRMSDQEDQDGCAEDADSEHVHRLLMQWHDLPLDDDDRGGG
ncbi:hypothetical protein B0H13DRAFT_2326769 [Mycena leptocephala]|nr:hypothetical protein B0H13DRAFT_2326769 [Mycena leptocephala]